MNIFVGSMLKQIFLYDLNEKDRILAITALQVYSLSPNLVRVSVKIKD